MTFRWGVWCGCGCRLQSKRPEPDNPLPFSAKKSGHFNPLWLYTQYIYILFQFSPSQISKFNSARCCSAQSALRGCVIMHWTSFVLKKDSPRPRKKKRTEKKEQTDQVWIFSIIIQVLEHLGPAAPWVGQKWTASVELGRPVQEEGLQDHPVVANHSCIVGKRAVLDVLRVNPLGEVWMEQDSLAPGTAQMC